MTSTSLERSPPFELLLPGLLLLFLAASASPAPTVVLNEDFADGDCATDPAWEAGDLHWFNPFFVEKIGDRYWAGSKRYGSFGTWFTLPDAPGAPVALDATKDPVIVSFDALFRPTTKDDALSFKLIGFPAGVKVRLSAEGHVLVRAEPSKESSLKPVGGGGGLPPIDKGAPHRVEVVVGGPKGATVAIDGAEVFAFPAAKLEAFQALLGRFERIAFIGANITEERDIPLLVPEMQDTDALRWIANIRVEGTVLEPEAPDMPPVQAPHKTVLLMQGHGALCDDAAWRLREAGWDVTEVYDQEPLVAGNAAALRAHLTPENLATLSWVVLFDLHTQRLGRQGCLNLFAYARAGGRLLVLGGASSLNRGGYFSSALAPILPVTGEESPGALERRNGSSLRDFVFALSPTPDARAVDGAPPFFERSSGAGRVRVVPWATLGAPADPFWRRDGWIEYLLEP